MTRWLIAMTWLAAAAATARADDTRVRSDDTRVRGSATVEVLDDKTQVDDVISRLRAQPQTDSRAGAAAQAVKLERPPAPPPANRAATLEPKEQQPGTRRPNRERNGNPDHTERIRPHHRR
jgi:hypothetical protein